MGWYFALEKKPCRVGPDCTPFLPSLKTWYERSGAQRKGFEIIYVSSDMSKDQQDSAFASGHGDWLQIEVGDRLIVLQLKLQSSLQPLPQFGDPKISELKRKYSVCAGKEVAAVGVKDRKASAPLGSLGCILR